LVKNTQRAPKPKKTNSRQRTDKISADKETQRKKKHVEKKEKKKIWGQWEIHTPKKISHRNHSPRAKSKQKGGK